MPTESVNSASLAFTRECSISNSGFISNSCLSAEGSILIYLNQPFTSTPGPLTFD